MEMVETNDFFSPLFYFACRSHEMDDAKRMRWNKNNGKMNSCESDAKRAVCPATEGRHESEEKYWIISGRVLLASN